jgi:hypothetical protein
MRKAVRVVLRKLRHVEACVQPCDSLLNNGRSDVGALYTLAYHHRNFRLSVEVVAGIALDDCALAADVGSG